MVEEVTVELRTRHTHMLDEPVEGALPLDQVHERREGQRRDHHDVRERFDHAPLAFTLSALSAVGRTYLAGPLTPVLVAGFGWPVFFVLTVVIALPGLGLLWWMRGRVRALDA